MSGPGPAPSNAAVVFSKFFSTFTWKFQSTSPARLCFPLEVGLLYFEALVVPSGACDLCRDKQLLVPQAEHRQACSVPTSQPYVHRPPPHPPQAPLGAAFVADSIWFHRTWKRTRDTWHCPPISHVQDHLQRALRGSPGPTTPNRHPVSTIVCTGLAFSQLTCLRRGRCEKLETNWLPPREGSFLVQKGRKYLCGISFFFPSSSSKKKKKIQRDSLS